MLAVVTVTNLNDVVDGDVSSIASLLNDQGADGVSLREAIKAANANAGKDTIEFATPGIITLGLELDFISDSVVIDATTMSGYIGAPLITINGANTESASGLLVTANDTQIHGLSFIQFDVGVSLFGNGNTISDSYLGINSLGDTHFGNAWAGVQIQQAFDNVIENNVISGNGVFGILIEVGGRNTVLGNRIGTSPDGLSPAGNGSVGVAIIDSSNNIIGGFIDVDTDRNIISGNLNGVVIAGESGVSQDNKIRGNYIGTDVSGQQPLPNLSDGVQLWNLPTAPTDAVTSNIIGGDDDDDGLLDGVVRYRNIISGNGDDGVALFGSQVKENYVEGNWIGLTADGESALPNRIGVTISRRVGDPFSAAASLNHIGGEEAGAGNVISGNTFDGVQLIFGAHDNSVEGNFIGTDSSGETTSGSLPFVLGNKRHGILIQDAIDNTVASNVIADNAGSGVVIEQGDPNFITKGNIVSGNVIGMSFDEGMPLGNGIDGISIKDSAENYINSNTIGNNFGYGIKIEGQLATGNEMTLNMIGTNAEGVSVEGNYHGGVYVQNASGTKIGAALNGNVISSNEGPGIELTGPMTTGTVIVSNFIGTTKDGEDNLGNLGHGILISDGASDNVIGNKNDPDGLNVIAYNGKSVQDGGTPMEGYGIQVESGAGNEIRGNSIFKNVGKGINLGREGFGSVANLSQNTAVVERVQFRSNDKLILWSLTGDPGSYEIDVFADTSASGNLPHASGSGDAFELIDSFLVEIEEGIDRVTFVKSYSLAIDQSYISLTVTKYIDGRGNTSELSLVDTDGDAIADAWETQGMGIDADEDGYFELDLWAKGARPDRKDIFVEIDTMAGFAPSQDVLDLAPPVELVV